MKRSRSSRLNLVTPFPVFPAPNRTTLISPRLTKLYRVDFPTAKYSAASTYRISPSEDAISNPSVLDTLFGLSQFVIIWDHFHTQFPYTSPVGTNVCKEDTAPELVLRPRNELPR